MKGPTLPDPETWDRMTAEQQWAFMRLSAATAEYNRQCAWITRLLRSIAHSFRA
jgi:hypothetical protein